MAKYFSHLKASHIQEDIKKKKESQKEETKSNNSEISHKTIVGLQQNEASIVNTLPATVLEEFSNVLQQELDSDNEDTLPDLNEQPKLQQLLTHQNFKLLQQILEELQHHNKVKWS